MILAFYSTDSQNLKNFIEKYKVNYIMLDDKFSQLDYLTANTRNNAWLQLHPHTEKAILNLQQGQTPALKSFQESCAVFQTGSPARKLVVLDTNCIIQKIN
jgi:hypothetical protein